MTGTTRIKNTLFHLFALTGLTFSLLSQAETTLNKQQKNVLNFIPVPVEHTIKYLTLQKAMKHFHVPALSFSVIENGKTLWNHASGYTDSTASRKIDTDTLFQAGSLTKTVTALTAMKLVEMKRLTLDTHINSQLQGWKIPDNKTFNGNDVTLRELLSMSSGLNTGGGPGYIPGEKTPDLLNILTGKPPATNPPAALVYKPGTHYAYSNTSYEVVELLINSIMPEPFVSTVQHTLFTPLGIKRSTFEQPLSEKLQLDAAKATDNKGNTFPYGYRVIKSYAAGGLWSTPKDLSRIVETMIAGWQGEQSALISKKMAHEALTAQCHTPYGLGFVIDGNRKTRHFMKMGQTVGYQSWLVGFPETGQGAVVMTNSDNGRELAQAVILAIAKAWQWPTDGKLKDAWML